MRRIKKWIGVAESLGQEKFASRTKMIDEESRFLAENYQDLADAGLLTSWCPGNSAVAVKMQGLSARAYHRVLKVAHTISDLGGEREVVLQPVAEAVQYRQLDRQMPA